MKNIVKLMKTIHQILLFTLLFVLAGVPFFYSLSVSTTFMVIPILFILLTVLGVFIDYKFTQWQKQLNSIGQNNKQHSESCPFIKGICC